jgi:hypothetical protein
MNPEKLIIPLLSRTGNDTTDGAAFEKDTP